MTNKEFFLETLKNEGPIFVRVLEAVPQDKLDWKPQDKSRSAMEMINLFAGEIHMLVSVATTGEIDVTKGEAATASTAPEAIAMFSAGITKLQAGVEALSESDWDNLSGKMIHPGGAWEEKRGMMIWHLFFDLIHHRGQLSTYIRPMGGKVPSIYGPSADSAM